MPPELRRQVLEAINEGEEEGDPFASMDGDFDTMVPEGPFTEKATFVGPDGPEDAVGSMQHMLSKQMAALKGTKHRGLFYKDEDPANPERFVKGKGGDKEIIPIMQEPTVVFCDLATTEGREAYEKVMTLLATSLGTYQLFEPERPPHIEVDRQGVPHAIVILKYCKMTRVVAVKQEAYTEVSEESMKEKFFPNHKAIKLVDEDPGSLQTEETDEAV